MSDFSSQNMQPGANPLLTLIATIQQTNRQLGQLTQQVKASFPQFVTVPANSAAAGLAGQMSYEPGFLYMCVGTNHWQRVAIADF